MDISTLGIDIGKTWFHIVGLNRAGKPIMREKRRRKDLMPFLANVPPCLVGMEACPGSQQLARSLIAQGHQARIIPAQFVRPFLKAGKNDFNDAEAIAEAVTRPSMRFVHDRTAVLNQIRAFLLENDIPIRTGRTHLRRELPDVLEDAQNRLSDRLRSLLHRLWQHWETLELQIKEINAELKLIANTRDDYRRLLTVPGRGGPRRLDRDRELISEVLCIKVLEREGAEDDPKKAT
jgi:transposase